MAFPGRPCFSCIFHYLPTKRLGRWLLMTLTDNSYASVRNSSVISLGQVT